LAALGAGEAQPPPPLRPPPPPHPKQLSRPPGVPPLRLPAQAAPASPPRAAAGGGRCDEWDLNEQVAAAEAEEAVAAAGAAAPRVPRLRLACAQAPPPATAAPPALLALLLHLLLSPDGAALRPAALGPDGWRLLGALQAALLRPGSSLLPPLCAALAGARAAARPPARPQHAAAADLLRLLCARAAAAALRPNAIRAGAVLGRGAFGCVRAARPARAAALLRPRLAAKLLDAPRAAGAARAAEAEEAEAGALAAAVAEAAALRAMAGSGWAPRLLAAGRVGDSLLLLLPRAACSLAAWRRAHGPAAAAAAARLYCQLYSHALAALAAAHAAGIAHGDVKADNFLLFPAPGGGGEGGLRAPSTEEVAAERLPMRLMLADWGCASRDASAQPASPRRGGSECARAPELLGAGGGGGGGAAADVWAAGLLLPELLLGAQPLAAEAERDWGRFWARLARGPESEVLPPATAEALAAVHPELPAFARGLLRRRPGDRPAAAEAGEAWRALWSGRLRLELEPYKPPPEAAKAEDAEMEAEAEEAAEEEEEEAMALHGEPVPLGDGLWLCGEGGALDAAPPAAARLRVGWAGGAQGAGVFLPRGAAAAAAALRAGLERLGAGELLLVAVGRPDAAGALAAARLAQGGGGVVAALQRVGDAAPAAAPRVDALAALAAWAAAAGLAEA